MYNIYDRETSNNSSNNNEVGKRAYKIAMQYLVSFDDGKINDGGVEGLNIIDGLKKAKVLERVSDSERSKRVIGEQEKWPCESHTVEAHRLDTLGNHIQRLLI